jgi:hypothetical protein
MRAVASHAGSSAWIHGHVAPGNGDARGDFGASLDAIVSVAQRIATPPPQHLVRADGAYGGVPALTAMIERGMPFVTRAAQDLMSLPDVQARLTTATWTFVPDAEIAGLRSVAELGGITLEPSSTTVDEGGRPFANVTVRAVVSRLPTSKEARRGRAIDGWQYEVFLTTLAADAWPAPEVVMLYNGRAACENRYAQEDRELGLDRVFCFHPAGQELASIIGMMVWNMLVVRGFRTASVPNEAPALHARQAKEDGRNSKFPSPVQDSTPMDEPQTPDETSSDVNEANSDIDESPSEPEKDASALPALDRLHQALDALPWPELLLNRPGWCWNLEHHCLQCPDGQLLHLMTVRPQDRAHGVATYFTARAGTCRSCPLLDECLRSKTHRTAKQLNITLPDEAGLNIKALLGALVRSPLGTPRTRRPPQTGVRHKEPSPRRGGHILHPLETATAGQWAAMPAMFLPAAARRSFCSLAELVPFEIGIDLSVAACRTPCSPLLAPTQRHVRHGRIPWSERASRNALPVGAQVRITAVARREVAALLLGSRPVLARSA